MERHSSFVPNRILLSYFILHICSCQRTNAQQNKNRHELNPRESGNQQVQAQSFRQADQLNLGGVARVFKVTRVSAKPTDPIWFLRLAFRKSITLIFLEEIWRSNKIFFLSLTENKFYPTFYRKRRLRRFELLGAEFDRESFW